MELGTILVRGTIAASLAAYTAAEWLRIRGSERSAGRARALWTIGAILAVAHTGLAFHLRYNWSHGAASADGAAQIAAVMGWGWDGAPYVNYVFLSLWAADAARWWVQGAASARDRLRTAMSALALFMFFNGAVIFARGWYIRTLGIVSAVIVLAAGALSGGRAPWYRGRPND